jgi:hypothetical protein
MRMTEHGKSRRQSGNGLMKFATDRPCANPKTAARIRRINFPGDKNS